MRSGKLVNIKYKIIILVIILFITSFNAIASTDCIEEWVCTPYGICNGEYQTRTCTEINGCDYVTDKPETIVSCGYYLSEPATCGNGIVDKGESYLNCNKDINITASHYFLCIKLGSDKCLYYQDYLKNIIFYSFIAFFILYAFFGPKN